ncbi:MAG: dihydrolipoyl dehydrogenase family protein [Halobacteriales archaeon]
MVRVAVIGAFGSAGVAAAEELLHLADSGRLDDLELVLVDDGAPGGLCILRGCMPSKDVLTAGAHRFQASHDDRLQGRLAVDVDAVVERKDEHVDGWAGHRRDAVAAMAERPEVTMRRERATFEDAHTLRVGDETLAVDHAIVATGSTPRIPPIEGLDDVVRTSRDLLDETDLPDRAVVVGFGFIGIELVPYLATVGDTDVVVIDRNDRPLPEADPAFGESLLALYRDTFGIDVETGAEVRTVERDGDDVVVTFENAGGDMRYARGEALYAFTGRRPNLDGLGLDALGLEPRPGWVDDSMRAVDAEGIYVVGDANGREPLLHVAKEEGIAAARTIDAVEAGRTPPTYAPTVHRVVFSGLGLYPFARVGHTTATAQAAGHEVVTVTRRASQDGIFAVKDLPEGLARLVVDADDGTVLGYQGLHHHADVFAKTAQIVVEHGLPVEAIPDRAYHPTTPELLDGLVREAVDARDRLTTA